MPAQIMAIINTSPESFAGDGLDVADEAALRARLRQAIDEGADSLDIGGQSTRPGADLIPPKQEIARVVPAIRLARSLTALPISIDTFKPAVAQAALAAGATIINDIQGGADPAMVKLMTQSAGDVIIMHSRGTPQTMSQLTDYPKGVVEELCDFFVARTQQLIAAGIDARRIIIDPGIGFAKTAQQSYEITRRLIELTNLGFRLLYGASNKSLIGKALAKGGEMAPVAERAEGTVVLQAWAMQHGAHIIRVHDVAAAVRTRRVVEALQGQGRLLP